MTLAELFQARKGTFEVIAKRIEEIRTILSVKGVNQEESVGQIHQVIANLNIFEEGIEHMKAIVQHSLGSKGKEFLTTLDLEGKKIKELKLKLDLATRDPNVKVLNAVYDIVHELKKMLHQSVISIQRNI